MKRANTIVPHAILPSLQLALNNLENLYGKITVIRNLKGLSNHNLLLEFEDPATFNNKKYKFVVLKLLHLNDITKHSNEGEVNKTFSQLGICPAILLNKFPHYYVIEYITGTPLKKNYFNQPQNIMQLFTLLSKLHLKRVGFVANNINFFHNDRELLKACNNNLIVDDITAKLHFIEQKLLTYPPTIAFCHNDLLTSNFIVDSNNKLMCIDFEYSGFSDVFFDLASLQHVLYKKHYQELVSIYRKALYAEMSSEIFLQKLQLFKLLGLVTTVCWYLYMSQQYSHNSSYRNRIYHKNLTALLSSMNVEFKKHINNSY